MERYNPKTIESKWQKKWADSQIYVAKDFDDKPKYTVLTEFPYPSGAAMHMGHAMTFGGGDIVARYKRAQGFNVLFPMGFDAFGLPAESFAIKNKVTPQMAVEQNIAHFRHQLERMGYSFDWSRSFSTTDPEYYKWTQWLFLQFFKAGLAYQDEININWCPFCKTGLANEEVINGRHERCDNLVEKKKLKQWLLKITDYAERLIDGLKDVDYPSRVADQQINWIGKSIGAEVDFTVADQEYKIKVFTTRPDTLFGATFMVLAPEHSLVSKITTKEQKAAVDSYIKATQGKSDIERQDTNRAKTGVFTGAYAINPATQERIPIWIADYVLMGYGTGAIMAVPAHDDRDWEFARKFNIPITEVIGGGNIDREAYTGDGKLVNSGYLDGLDVEEAKRKIVTELAKKGIAQEKVNYKLHDWVYSRQRYWGEPIPIVHCDKCGAVPVPDNQLPVELPIVDHYEPTGDGQSPLSKIETWVNTACPKCKEPAKRETDTMPNWAGSNWYYLRYFDPHNNETFADAKKLKYWGMVDLYMGGMEHTTLHLLYSRFHHQFMYDQGLVPTPEPYAARRGHGMLLTTDGTKMSKSKDGGVVDPISVADDGYGVDAVRMALAFLAPYDQSTPWSPEAVAGCYRFLTRVWNLVNEPVKKSSAKSPEDVIIQKTINKTIKKVGADLEKTNFNTAIAALMEALNEFSKIKNKGSAVWHEAIRKYIQLLAPFAPHVTEEIWCEVWQEKESVHLSKWPEYDEKLTVDEFVKIGVQINGKLRGEIEVTNDTAEAEALKLAGQDANVAGYLDGKKSKKVIYVAGRILNIIV
ncbi:leucine--tRNA ligase [Candidatus Saccharibacteria bacterium]|nr:leucine--tRNA ligase [Candidatus Saccharibacteria bacterium]